LLERGTFKVVLREEIPKHAPVMNGVLVIKNSDTDQEVYKARHVMLYKVFWIHSNNVLCIIHQT
jgi:hypothetical protein